MLDYIRHVPYRFVQGLVPDFSVGSGRCVLFLALRYHATQPGYLVNRMRTLDRGFKHRILLVLMDMQDSAEFMLQITRLCVQHDFTMLCAFTMPEAARYLETLQAYEFKPPDALQERLETTYLPRAQEALTTVRSLNKTDVVSLLSHFGSVADIFRASQADFMGVPGMGDLKSRRLFEATHLPFNGGGGK